jgi:hypothetical protein
MGWHCSFDCTEGGGALLVTCVGWFSAHLLLAVMLGFLLGD